jgi:hypothetical protein
LNVSEIIDDKEPVEDKKEEEVEIEVKPLIKSELSAQDQEKLQYIQEIEKE